MPDIGDSARRNCRRYPRNADRPNPAPADTGNADRPAERNVANPAYAGGAVAGSDGTAACRVAATSWSVATRSNSLARPPTM